MSASFEYVLARAFIFARVALGRDPSAGHSPHALADKRIDVPLLQEESPFILPVFDDAPVFREHARIALDDPENFVDNILAVGCLELA